MDPEQEEEEYLKNYKGIFKWESNNLYVTMRNLYSLAYQKEINLLSYMIILYKIEKKKQ